MRKLRPGRKARFKAALALADLGVDEWAKKAGVTRQHVNATLNNPKESAALIAAIDAFIAEVNERAQLVAEAV
jgi:hypothetical protein